MSKLAISIDMGAVNNGVFYCVYDESAIKKKDAKALIIDKNKINFSKKSRRENRHRVRSYARRKLAKRYFLNLFEIDSLSNSQKESVFGLFNNRGYTFLSSDSEFEEISEITSEFLQEYLEELGAFRTKEEFEKFLSKFEELEDLEKFVDEKVEQIEKITQLNKAEIAKEFINYKDDFKTIKDDLKNIKKLFLQIVDEIKNGAKPRKKYLQELKKEIVSLDFIADKDAFYNLVGNISNLQLRILRKLINQKDRAKQFEKLKNYFWTFHYKSEDEKQRKAKLFDALKNAKTIEEFFTTCSPLLTVPPYEDMNNRSTYKCNSLHLNIELQKEQFKSLKKILESEFSYLLEDGFEKNPTKYLQRFFDLKKDATNKLYHPREVYKHKNPKAIESFKKLFGKEAYENLKDIAVRYYDEEAKIIDGIFDEKNSIFTKCNRNTPYKNNIKEILLKPLYGCEFSNTQAEALIEKIKQKRGLKAYMELVATKAKEYQNRFYFVVSDCLEDAKCINDNDIKKIVKNLDKRAKELQEILKSLGIQGGFFEKFEKIDAQNIKRVLNIFKQTFEILFKDIHGFNKTCKACTLENNIRSSEERVIAKRLLSDVAKPIDGMLDMMLDRLAYEVVAGIKSDMLEDIEKVELFLEQNRFEFEEGLMQIKGKKNKKNTQKEIDICPYTGEKFTKGEYDHILPQSKELYNSKANLIYASIQGNKEKGNKRYFLENLHKKHLKEVFKTEDLEQIKHFINENIAKIDEDTFTNFDNLPTKQQIAFRYALFMDNNSEAFKKAKNLLVRDKIKAFSNGTQKRLAQFIYKKLQDRVANIELEAKTIDAKLVSATRMDLSFDHETGEVNQLFKEERQKSHSHCIDAMVVFYLATSKLKGQKHRQKEYISQMVPKFDFWDVYVDSSEEKKIKKTTIKEKILEHKPMDSIGSVETLFRENMLKNHYLNVFKIDEKFYYGESKKSVEPFSGFNAKALEYFIQKNILTSFDNGAYRVEKERLFAILFDDKEEVVKNKKFFKKLDELRYTTQKKSIVALIEKFLNPLSNDEKKFIQQLINEKKPTKLDQFNEANLYSYFAKGSKTQHAKIVLKIDKTWKIVAAFLANNKESFLQEADDKLIFDDKALKELLKKSVFFKTTHQRKRKVKKEYSLPLKDTTDKPFLIRRKDIHKNTIYQTVFAKNSARGFVGRHYIHAGDKNIIPLKFEDYLKAYATPNSK